MIFVVKGREGSSTIGGEGGDIRGGRGEGERSRGRLVSYVVLRFSKTATIPVPTTAVGATAAAQHHQKRLFGPSRRRRFFHLDLSLFFGDSCRGGCLFGHFPLFAFIFAYCSTGRTLAFCTCYAHATPQPLHSAFATPCPARVSGAERGGRRRMAHLLSLSGSSCRYSNIIQEQATKKKKYNQYGCKRLFH